MFWIEARCRPAAVLPSPTIARPRAAGRLLHCGTLIRPLSQMGQFRKSARLNGMSVLPPKAVLTASKSDFRSSPDNGHRASEWPLPKMPEAEVTTVALYDVSQPGPIIAIVRELLKRRRKHLLHGGSDRSRCRPRRKSPVASV